MKPTKFLIAAALVAAPAYSNTNDTSVMQTPTPSVSDTTGMSSPSDQIKEANSDKMDHSKFFSTSITFSPGSATLTEDSKGKLRQLVRDVRGSRDIEQVTIASWSDKSLPAKGAKVVDSDRDLADRRANAIRDIVRMELGVKDVDAYNMAEPANWLARTFNTKDAELKSVFGRTAEEAPVTREEFQLIKDHGAPGKAVVVAEYNHESEMSTDKPVMTTP